MKNVRSARLAFLVLWSIGSAAVSVCAQQITVDGRITGPGGAGVEGVVVDVLSLGGGGAVTTTDGTGDYRVDVPGGAIRITLQPPRATRMAEYNAWIGDHFESFTWNHTLQQGALVGGTLVLPDGTPPITGAVSFHPVTFTMRDGEWLAAPTDASTGEFEIVVPLGIYWVSADPPAGAFRPTWPIRRWSMGP